MHIRTKAILSVMLTTTVLTAVFIVMAIQQQNAHLKTIIDAKKKNSHFLADSIQKQIFAVYKSRIVSLATTKKEVIAAFAGRDREALYSATLPFYQTIKGENPFFTIMHFHLPDNTTFLRMHLPEFHGDNLGEIRPIVREVNATHEQQAGYEVGRKGLFYRVVQPVFAEKHYIGALEFGISYEQLAHLLQENISPDIAIAVKSQNLLNATLVPDKKIEKGEYTFLPLQSGIFRKIDLQTLMAQEDSARFSADGKTYVLFANIELENFQGDAISKILIALDISEELASTKNFIVRIVFFALFLLLFACLVLYFSFGQLLNRIVSLNASLCKSNEDLKNAKGYVDNILATMSDGLLVTSQTGTINKANSSLCRLLGCSETDLLGKNIYSFFGDAVDLEKTFADCRPTNWNISKVERQLLAGGGKKVPVLFSATPLADPEGNLLGIVCIITDITARKKTEVALRLAHDLLEQRVAERTRELAETNTALTREIEERKRAETELRQAQKMRAIGTLAGGIAHDFNNILTAILGYAQLALARTTSDTITRSYLDEVFVAGQRARELVRQILTFSRQSEQEKKPCEIQLIVKEALKLLRASLPANIEIIQNIPAVSGTVLADPTQIHQVVMNLCTNAYHAMQEKGGTLTVSLSETAAENISPALPLSGDYLQLVVSDTGTGMDTAILERLFEPYFTTKEAGKGTGLGLAVTHGIVESHAGHIQVTSTTGLGSTFRVYLPLHKKIAATAIASEEKKTVEGGNERILVVDDEKEIVQLLELVLPSYGYRVTGWSDSTAAYEWFCTNPHEVDLVITDMSMPHMTGKELAEKMLALRPELPVILCTGFSETIDENSAKQLGIRSFLLKPFQEKEIACRIREVLDN